MRQARGLAPYAAFAVLVVGASVAALVLTTLSGPPGGPSASAGPSARPTAAARATTDLSATGRLAYWRSEPNGDFLLWLANADNARRRSVAKADQPGAVSRTRWSAGGGEVAYVEGGVRLVVVRVDGATTSYTLAPELRADGYRIVDHRFSPSGAHIAATVQRQNGSQSDVYVSGAGGTWTRLTTTEDVLAADWISEDELLVQTMGGIVGRLRATGRDQLHPLTGLSGTTPIVGDDGRVYFLAGGITPFAGSAETLVFAAAPTVYSMTAEGQDLRREEAILGTDSFRLDGTWTGVGYLLHRGTSPEQLLAGKGAMIALPASGGQIERMQVSPDRRFALAFAGSNVLRLDIAPSGSVADTVVLLGSVAQGDAWFPRTATLAHVTPATVDVPAARYVFSLGGHLWTMGADGAPTLLRATNANGQVARRFMALPAPRWSPSGDRILTLEPFIVGSLSLQLIPVAISRDGTVRRYTTLSSVGTAYSWSPDGRQFAVTALATATSDPSVLARQLSVFVIDASSGAVARTLAGRESYWTSAGIVVLSNGTFRSGDRARSDQAIELVASDNEKRAVTTIATLVADPRLQAPSVTRGVTQTSGLTASADGAYAAVHLAFLSGTTGQSAFAIVRARDGGATAVVARDGVTDEAWAATGRLIGYTLSTPTSNGAGVPQRAVVRDAETGHVVQETDGRFAGWSPDGSWIYVARADGLYARRLAGGDPVRFSPYGVVVAVTKP